MSWNGYVDNLMAPENGVEICQHAAIVGYTDNKSVWASDDDVFAKITTDEIEMITGKDRTSFFINGLTLGGQKCRVIRDSLQTDKDWTMDIRTKSQEEGVPTYNICVGAGQKALVIVMGKEGVHGGKLNSRAYAMVDYLRKVNY